MKLKFDDLETMHMQGQAVGCVILGIPCDMLLFGASAEFMITMEARAGPKTGPLGSSVQTCQCAVGNPSGFNDGPFMYWHHSVTERL